MNTNLEKSKLEPSEASTFRQVESESVTSALERLKSKSEFPQPKPFARRVVTRWKELGQAHQHPAPDKSRWKIKRPHA